MGMLVADCPRCGSASITFDVRAQLHFATQYDWQNWYEIFCVCRACHRSTVFIVYLNEYATRELFYKSSDALVNHGAALNRYFRIDRHVSLRDRILVKPPDHLPLEINAAFQEAAACLSIACYNASAAMFRLCVDLATRPLLPDPKDSGKLQPNEKTRRDLGLRLRWLFDNNFIPATLRELAKSIREDANDAAHLGNLSKEDAEDILDFTVQLLERLFTEPKQLELAHERRQQRRKPKNDE
jgi:hypothetical protein